MCTEIKKNLMPKTNTHGGAGRGQGRKPKANKQKSYCFRCYPEQVDNIRKIIKEYKMENIEDFGVDLEAKEHDYQTAQPR
jgi:hypothetical protein